MRAVRFARHGGPEVLRVDHVPEPADPVRDEILVQVDASSVNGTDLGLRRGGARIATVGRLPFTLGFDLAGTVLSCGPAVTAFRSGDRVMALLGHAGGAQAERVVLRQGRAARVPSSCSAAAAAALPLAGLTALQALHGKAALLARPAGTRVLVTGASGGIGSYGVQLAKLSGAHVTAVTSRAGLAYAAELGADEVLERSTDLATLLASQRPAQWDVVLDSPGQLSLQAVRAVLTEQGVLASTRPLSRDVLRGLAPGRSRRGPRAAGVMTRARSQDLAQLAALVDAGLLRPPVDSVFPAEQAVEAHRHAEGPATGKVVLQMTA